MEMIVLKMKTDLEEMNAFDLGRLWFRVRSQVDHLHECADCRKSRGPEYHAQAVLHLGLIDAEIDARGDEIIRVQTNRAKRLFAHAMAPSAN